MLKLKKPQIWNQRSTLNVLLLPASFLYWLGSKYRQWRARPYKAPIPVICVGNIVVGGAGKTPTTIAIVKMLQAQGKKVAILTHGYGGNIANTNKAIQVQPEDKSDKVGDEALLLAAVAPTYICINRAIAAQAASLDGADVLVMDDGMQNHTLYKDFTLMVVNGAEQFGNEWLLPAGPLRESIKEGLHKTDAVLVIGENTLKLPSTTIPVYNTQVAAINPTKIKGRKYVAVCSIATPEKFFQTAKECGAKLLETISFPDHHNYTKDELRTIFDTAEALGIPVLTTAKDAVKFPSYHLNQTQVLEIEISIPTPLKALIRRNTGG